MQPSPLLIPPREQSSSIPSPCSPWRPLIYLPSAWICLLWTFRVNGVIHCMASCVCLLSLSIIFSDFIQVVTRLNTSFVLMAKYIVWIDHILFVNWWPFGLFPSPFFFLLWITLLFVYGFLCEHVFSIPSGIYLGVELPSHVLTPYLTFWGTARLFSKSLEIFKTEQNRLRVYGNSIIFRAVFSFEARHFCFRCPVFLA